MLLIDCVHLYSKEKSRKKKLKNKKSKKKMCIVAYLMIKLPCKVFL